MNKTLVFLPRDDLTSVCARPSVQDVVPLTNKKDKLNATNIQIPPCAIISLKKKVKKKFGT